jgi:hypothetical protein
LLLLLFPHRLFLLQVSPDYVWVDAPLLSMGVGHGSMRRQQGARVPRSKVFSQEQLQLPEQALEGLADYDAVQAAEDQQLLSSVDSMLNGGTTGVSSSAAMQQGSNSLQEQGQGGGSSSMSGSAAADSKGRKGKQQAAQTYANVEQQQENTLDLVGMVPEAAVDELVDAVLAHQTAAAAAAGENLGLQSAGGSGMLEGGVLYVQHGVGTGAVKRAVLKCLEAQHAKGSVRRWKDGADAGCTVVWLTLV